MHFPLEKGNACPTSVRSEMSPLNSFLAVFLTRVRIWSMFFRQLSLRNFCLRSDPLSFWAELQKFREFSKFSVKTQTLLQLRHIQSFPRLRQKSKQLGTCNLLEHNCSIETDTLDTVLRRRGTMYYCIWRQEMENYSWCVRSKPLQFSTYFYKAQCVQLHCNLT